MGMDSTAIVHVVKRFEQAAPEVSFAALIVDDDPDVRKYIVRVLREFSLEIDQAERLEDAVKLLNKKTYCMVFLDKCLPDGDGVEFSRMLIEKYVGMPVVIITGQGSGAEAVNAVDYGVFDYIPKPCSVQEIRDVAAKIFQYYLYRNLPPKKAVVREETDEPQLIGNSKEMVEVTKEAWRISKQKRHVLIQGATGTGKEIIAQKIHYWGAGPLRPFVPVNCAAIPTELIESELFGHVRGAFTGAEKDRMGLFEQAQGGTIFLDEITETPLLFQVKLLRVLQEGKIRRVGSSQEITLNLRVIAASNRNIKDEVANGRFRQDLYFRLKGSELYLPLLKDRTGDVMALAEYFADIKCKDRDIIFSQPVVKALNMYEWPGNVRELENVIDCAVQSCNGEVLLSDLPKDLKIAVGAIADDDEKPVIGFSQQFLTLDEVKRRHIEEVLRRHGGNRSRAALELGINRHTINKQLSLTGEFEGPPFEDDGKTIDVRPES